MGVDGAVRDADSLAEAAEHSALGALLAEPSLAKFLSPFIVPKARTELAPFELRPVAPAIYVL